MGGWRQLLNKCVCLIVLFAMEVESFYPRESRGGKKNKNPFIKDKKGKATYGSTRGAEKDHMLTVYVAVGMLVLIMLPQLIPWEAMTPAHARIAIEAKKRKKQI